jgi:lipoprotein-anchoring transpeptidase ErfK/SrfK
LGLAAALFSVAGCAAASSAANAAGPASSTGSPAGSVNTALTTAPPTKKYPTGPALLIDGIAPLNGTTVGIAMPISITFSDPIKRSARKNVEQHIKITTSITVTGAWHWFGSQRVDFRPKSYWTPGTKVAMVAALKHVGNGYGRYGTHGYARSFKIGSDLRTHVYVKDHKTVVTRNGKLLRSMPSDAGSPQFPTWDGTMAVVAKERTTRMTSCSVHIACNKNDPNYYDITLPWDVRITWSGTFVHYSTGDPYPGHSYGSHGCVHLSYSNAEWYYNLVKQGDPVTISGSPRGKPPGDNGYADYSLSWTDWLAGSALKAFTTSVAPA